MQKHGNTITTSSIVANLRSKYTAEKREVDKDSPVLYYILRPLSYYITVPFLKLGISANQVTFAGTAIGLAGCILLGFGSYWLMLVGAILIVICDIFDIIDGSIARYRGTSSVYGSLIDDVGGEIILSIVPFAIGIGVDNLLFGSVCTVCLLMRTTITEGYSAKFGAGARNFYRGKKGWSLWTVIYKCGIAVDRSMVWILLAGAVVGIVNWILMFWTLLAVCELIMATTWTLVKARSIE